MKKPDIIRLERERICCQTILAMIPFSGLIQDQNEQQQDYWTMQLILREEQLYNLRHGDSNAPA